ncbi:MAG: efflux RND transporter permease subunit [Candidatus Sulfomarinibacteraceae bacterium]
MIAERETPSTVIADRSFLVDRPVAILMVFLATVVFGFFSFLRLPVSLMPELSYPTLTVRTEYPGAAPEEVENDVSRPIEEALGVVGGLRRISSISRAGVSDVVLEFSWGVEMTEAIQDTLEKLDLVFLPDEAERPLILRFDPTLDPVLELSLSGEGVQFEGEEGLRRLRRLAELQVKRALEPVKGVAAVRVRGGLEEEIHVLIDADRLRHTGLSTDDVIRRLAEENINVAGGTLREGRTEYMVRTLNEYTDLTQIGDTIVSFTDGRQVRIRDLGEVVWANSERQITTRTDGLESVQIEVFKEADANIVALADRVKERVGELDREALDAPEKPRERRRGGPGERGGSGEARRTLADELYLSEGAILTLVADRSVFIQDSIDEVRNAAVFGGILAVLVLFLFLRNVRSTAIIAISIPISILVTFAPLNLFGVSLNIMSLGGLALGIGMLVDSSIVVLESIFRCREEGDDTPTAAVRGVAEVRMAVLASTLTSIAVFAPMVFVEGVAGQAFGDLGLAVVISLLAALVVALVFIPMLASRRGFSLGQQTGNLSMLAPVRSYTQARRDFGLVDRWWKAPLALYFVLRAIIGTVVESVGAVLLVLLAVVAALFRFVLVPVFNAIVRLLMSVTKVTTQPLLDFLNRVYARSIRWALRRPGVVATIALATLAATVAVAMSLSSELLPEVHQGEFTVEVALPVGTPLEQTEDILGPVEAAIMAERDHIEALIVTFGFDPATSQRSDEGEHSARFKLILDTSDPRVEAQVLARIRARLDEIPDLESRMVRPVLFSFRTPVEVEIHGDNLLDLRRMSERVAEVMGAMPELADVETSQKVGAPEVQIEYDREQLARYGLNIETVAARVRDAVKGAEASLYNLGDRRIPIVVRFAEADRREVTDVADFLVNPGGDRPIPLGAVADVTLAEGPSEVRRIDGRRVAMLSANLGVGSLGGAVAALEEALATEIDWPAEMTFFITGQNEEWERSRSSLLLALSLSIFLVYVIMAAQFESLVQPLIIMLTIPLAFFGTVLTLKALGISLSVVVFLGMIMLAGIVVNNAIVLVDYINRLKRRGMDRVEAVVTAGAVRLRPILMTTATTVLGLLPMALGLGDGAEIRTPMAIAVISGLIASTALTLLIIPALYAVVDGFRDRVLARVQSGRPREETP